MVGITSYGAYLPYFRMGKETAGYKGRNEKAVANFDEDSITMAVTAAIDTLNGANRSDIDGLYFATTTPPYAEKMNAAVIANALDLRTDIMTADFANTLRAGTIALRSALDAVKAGSAKQVMVTAADMRQVKARSEFEPIIGDGAAAFIIGNEKVIAEIEASYTVTNQMLDIWRAATDAYVRSSEDRFVAEEGYLKILPQAVDGLLKKCGLTPKDFTKAVLYAHDAKKQKEVAKMLGFDTKSQVSDALFSQVGNSGAAFGFMMLAQALEEAAPGDRILFATYGDGADAYVLKVTDEIKNLAKRRGVSGYLNSKAMIKDYLMYCNWKKLIDIAPPGRRPEQAAPSAMALNRDADWVYKLQGVTCNHCGYSQFPPQRVCVKCQSKDDFTPVRFSDKKATLYTFTVDNIQAAADPPSIDCIIDFEGGGRMKTIMADRIIEGVKIGMPLEMVFRKLFTVDGIHNYYWKCAPLRD